MPADGHHHGSWWHLRYLGGPANDDRRRCAAACHSGDAANTWRQGRPLHHRHGGAANDDRREWALAARSHGGDAANSRRGRQWPLHHGHGGATHHDRRQWALAACSHGGDAAANANSRRLRPQPLHHHGHGGAGRWQAAALGRAASGPGWSAAIARRNGGDEAHCRGQERHQRRRPVCQHHRCFGGARGPNW